MAYKLHIGHPERKKKKVTMLHFEKKIGVRDIFLSNIISFLQGNSITNLPKIYVEEYNKFTKHNHDYCRDGFG